MTDLCLLCESDTRVSQICSPMQKRKASRPALRPLSARRSRVDGDHKYKHRFRNVDPHLAKLLWRSVGPHFHVSQSPPSLSSPPFHSTLANTYVLIPAPSTLSAGGHRQTPPPPPTPFPPPSFLPCFSTHSCLSNGAHLGEIEPSAEARPDTRSGLCWLQGL